MFTQAEHPWAPGDGQAVLASEAAPQSSKALGLKKWAKNRTVWTDGVQTLWRLHQEIFFVGGLHKRLSNPMFIDIGALSVNQLATPVLPFCICASSHCLRDSRVETRTNRSIVEPHVRIATSWIAEAKSKKLAPLEVQLGQTCKDAFIQYSI